MQDGSELTCLRDSTTACNVIAAGRKSPSTHNKSAIIEPSARELKALIQACRWRWSKPFCCVCCAPQRPCC